MNLLKRYRTLGTAKTNDTRQWEYVGLIPLFDPPREDSAETIKTAQDMGVNVKMITGDHTAIAKQIAHRLILRIIFRKLQSFLEKSDKEAVQLLKKQMDLPRFSRNINTGLLNCCREINILLG